MQQAMIEAVSKFAFGGMFWKQCIVYTAFLSQYKTFSSTAT